MALPLVTIVGRPNVGKSSLLNMLARRRISIVDPTAGVTRDRIQTVCEHDGVYFEVVDTGGYGIVDRDDLNAEVEQQIRFAVNAASLILFTVDAKDGLMPLDQAVAGWLREAKRPVLVLANKVDAPDTAVEMGDFHRLGFGEPLQVSAVHRRGEEQLKDWIVTRLRDSGELEKPGETVMKIAIVGRQNVGKSTMINALAGQGRVIVSEIPGTTRDAIDVRFEQDGRTYLAIDTAGLKKRSKSSGDDIDFYSYHRAQLSVRRADVVLLLIDATADISQVDKQLGAYIASQFKPCIIVVNKWDLAKTEASTDDYGEYLSKTLRGLSYAPIAFTTASKARNVQAVVDLAMNLFKQSRTRVGTGQLNAALKEIMSINLPKAKHGSGEVKIMYATQVASSPPTVVLFVNDPARVTPTFERFIIGRFRELLPFAEVPIRLLFRSRRSMGKMSKGQPPAPADRPRPVRQGEESRAARVAKPKRTKGGRAAGRKQANQIRRRSKS